jgi:hypothetical protein
MDDKQEGFPDVFDQEVDDLIDATMDDQNSARAVKRMEEAIQRGIPKSQLSTAYLVLGAQTTFVETDNYRNTAFRLYESFDFQVIQNVLVYRKDYGDMQN